MQEEWKTIPGFEGYGISSHGRVENRATGRILVPSVNQQGHLKVNLLRSGSAFTRSINGLVARAFLDDPPRRDFNSVIHLDGDKANCRATNLMWRPRYFSIMYHQQFSTPQFRRKATPMIEIRSGEKYDSIQQVIMQHGLLYSDVLISAHERTVVWPTYQEFRVLAE